jgi:hypothetical protein
MDNEMDSWSSMDRFGCHKESYAIGIDQTKIYDETCRN